MILFQVPYEKVCVLAELPDCLAAERALTHVVGDLKYNRLDPEPYLA